MFSLLLALIYICFISLGLPDSLLGSAWPVLHVDIGVPMSYAGIISMVIFIGTIISSLMCDRVSRKLGSGLMTAVSVSLTAIALFGFSISHSFFMLILFAIPYGLGAGGVDAVLNNYVALHYKAQHMSWLHCFWGVGASISPYIMSFSLVKLNSWSRGYLIVSIIQMCLCVFIFLSLPLWKKRGADSSESIDECIGEPLKIRDIISIKGAIFCFFMFFCYCSLELTTSLWATSYLVESRGIGVNIASAFASLFYIGITLGRAINGFLAMRFSDKTLIRVGMVIVTFGIALMFIPIEICALSGFIIIGLGCAPIYPCIIHMTPDVFGRDKSQAMIGIQMAFAYIGFCVMPPLFGVIAEKISISLLPAYQLIILIAMAIMHELMIIKTRKTSK